MFSLKKTLSVFALSACLIGAVATSAMAWGNQQPSQPAYQQPQGHPTQGFQPQPGYQQPAPQPGYQHGYQQPVPPNQYQQPARPNQYQQQRPQHRPSAYASGPIRGNVQSKRFHAPNCKFYNSKHCRAVFNSPAEAMRAGFKPCKKCIKY